MKQQDSDYLWDRALGLNPTPKEAQPPARTDRDLEGWDSRRAPVNHGQTGGIVNFGTFINYGTIVVGDHARPYVDRSEHFTQANRQIFVK